MAHIHENIDFTVGAYIVHNHKVLLVDHKKLKSWMPIGGHIELDEDPDQALLREIQEECGLEVEVIADKPEFNDPNAKPLWRPRHIDIHNISDTHRHVGLVYICKSSTDQVRLAAGEHNDIRWFSADEIFDPQFKIGESVRFYAKLALYEIEN